MNLAPMFALLLAAMLAAGSAVSAAEPTAVPAQARPPAWYAKGAYVFRVSTPDEADVLPQLEEGHAIVANLLDSTVPQITIVAGLIGHDHPGAWNWDGVWPYWNRATFRAGSFEKLAAFMARAKEKSNVHTGFHLNLTDVNIGLRDYSESRAFFQKLVETKSIYRRNWSKETNRRDGEPFVPLEIDKYSSAKPGQPLDPVQIFALVNYKNFWASGLAKEMIDDFYRRLPFAPPMLYLDVLNAGGGNFSTGFPDGPLGGSKETQIEGMQAIADYLHSKGTDVGTEGRRRFLGTNAQGVQRAGYVWYHGQGWSDDDYQVVDGGGVVLPMVEQTFGSPGAFAVSPIASTPGHLARVREHYAALLAGKTSSKKMPGLETAHICIRTGKDEFDIPGTGATWRGDWADLVNNFYLISIQELYHVGKRNVRVSRSPDLGWHFDKAILAGPAGREVILEAEKFVTDWTRDGAIKSGSVCMQYGSSLNLTIEITEPGDYGLKLRLNTQDHDGELNVCVNGEFHRNTSIKRVGYRPITGDWPVVDFGTVKLRAGANTITVDTGRIRAEWSDGTQAVWATPGIAKGFKAWKDDVVFAVDYDRMWPDTWSGQQKIYFFSWDGTNRAWKLPADWGAVPRATLYPLTPSGRGRGVSLQVHDRTIAPSLLSQVPYVLESR
ncbi:MAG TPA: glycoside hydrolase family 101 beta sandwich domain-containing protein [Phycisphaerae bacterium]|nr:glycoside hydrolase family 101 beta sandwich domain-containing protein [Phycisphaerae bacterium]